MSFPQNIPATAPKVERPRDGRGRSLRNEPRACYCTVIAMCMPSATCGRQKPL